MKGHYRRVLNKIRLTTLAHEQLHAVATVPACRRFARGWTKIVVVALTAGTTAPVAVIGVFIVLIGMPGASSLRTASVVDVNVVLICDDAVIDLLLYILSKDGLLQPGLIQQFLLDVLFIFTIIGRNGVTALDGDGCGVTDAKFFQLSAVRKGN